MNARADLSVAHRRSPVSWDPLRLGQGDRRESSNHPSVTLIQELQHVAGNRATSQFLRKAASRKAPEDGRSNGVVAASPVSIQRMLDRMSSLNPRQLQRQDDDEQSVVSADQQPVSVPSSVPDSDQDKIAASLPGSGQLVVPDVTVVGEQNPGAVAAYRQGFTDGQNGAAEPNSIVEGPSGDAYENGYRAGLAAPKAPSSDDRPLDPNKQPDPTASAEPGSEPEPETETEVPEWLRERSKPDEVPEDRNGELARYEALKHKVKQLRRLRWQIAGDPDAFEKKSDQDKEKLREWYRESQLSEGEREEYQELYNKFGASDTDPEALPAPLYGESEGEGEEEGEAVD